MLEFVVDNNTDTQDRQFVADNNQPLNHGFYEWLAKADQICFEVIKNIVSALLHDHYRSNQYFNLNRSILGFFD